MNYLGKNIVFLRKKSNTTQAKIQSQLGFMRNTQSNWETGRTEPSADTIIKYCDYFNVTLDDILRRDLSEGNLIENEKIEKNRQKGNLNTENTPIVGLLQDPTIGYNTPSTREHIQLQIIAEKDKQINSQEITIRTLKLALEQALKGRK